MRGVRFCRAQRWFLSYLREDLFKGLKVIVFLLVLVLTLVMTLSVGLIDPYVTSETHKPSTPLALAGFKTVVLITY
jgi:hypothetical protein